MVVDSATCDPFEELSDFGTVFHHHLMNKEKSDETARNPLSERQVESKNDPRIQPQRVKRNYFWQA